MNEVDLVGIEIGIAGELTLGACAEAVMAFVMARKEYPDAEFNLMVGGYDDDPREVWDIPEVKRYFRLFMGSAMKVIGDGDTMFSLRLDDATMGVVAMCLDIGRIVGRDPVTGVYDIRIDKPEE
jgi:hypothetical protein